MTDRKLNIVLGAVDKATPVIKGVKGQLRGIGSEASRGLANANRNVQRGIAVAAGFVAFNAQQGIASLIQLGDITHQTEAAIKSTKGAANITADAIRAQAEELEHLSTVDDKVIQAGQNMLLTFTNVKNRVGEGNDIFNQATSTLLDMSVALGVEPQKAAIQLGKALNDPIKGITALRRVGVQFTEQQEKQIRAMVEAGDVMGAQKVILRELNTEFGGSAAARGRDGPGATWRRFQDAVEDSQMALARGFLPLMERVATKAQQIFSDPKVLAGIEEFGKFLGDKLDSGIDFLEANWDGIAGAFSIMGEGAKTAINMFASAPPWLQTAILTGWGLNKLTGGALGSIVGQLGSGLVKGVLGMNAGVVNIRAAVVNGPGGPGAGGKPPVAGAPPGFLAPGFGTAAAGVALPFVMFNVIPELFRNPNAKPTGVERDLGGGATVKLDPQTTAQLTAYLPQIVTQVEAAGGKIVTEGARTAGAVWDVEDSLDKTRSDVRDLNNPLNALKAINERMRADAASSDAAMLSGIRGVKAAQDAAKASQAAQHAKSIERQNAQLSRLDSINAKDFSPNVNVRNTTNVGVTANISVSATSIAQSLRIQQAATQTSFTGRGGESRF